MNSTLHDLHSLHVHSARLIFSHLPARNTLIALRTLDSAAIVRIARPAPPHSIARLVTAPYSQIVSTSKRTISPRSNLLVDGAEAGLDENAAHVAELFEVLVVTVGVERLLLALAVKVEPAALDLRRSGVVFVAGDLDVGDVGGSGGDAESEGGHEGGDGLEEVHD